MFGDEFTKRFEEVYNARVFIKHDEPEKAAELLDGKLKEFLDDPDELPGLAEGLKRAINIVYGLTSAKFDNPFKDPRNKDNIVAKRGALFMIDLKHAVQEMGYTVAHIKTDSIKIPNYDEKIKNFVFEFGKKYGYTFEHEATYEKMCLVNDAVYVAKYEWAQKKNKIGTWETVGTQFSVPYVFKTLFSNEPIVFSDVCETKSATTSLYLDMNEKLWNDEFDKLEKEAKRTSKYISDHMSIEEGEKGYIPDDELALIDLENDARYEELKKGHNYQFVGKVGSFCPIKPGCNGGLLMREKEGEYHAATGTKGFRWLEAEKVKEFNLEDDIDHSYYGRLVDEAIKKISEFGDFEWFVSEDK